MGSGAWSSDVFTTTTSTRAASGIDDFGYDSTLRSTPRSSWKVHETLSPTWLNSAGMKIRESRDSFDHPETIPVAVFLDVTGSMSFVVRTLHKKIPDLLGILLRKGYVEHPHILFGAIGDATCDAVPLQVGQFEADNRMDENLENVVLEGGGGPYSTESYELAMYFMARHTELDSLNRDKKGYLFIIGDEIPYGAVKYREVNNIIGDSLQSDVPTAEIVKELQEKYETFFILPKGASGGGSSTVLNAWREYFGQNVLELDDPSAVSETIALTIGLREGVIDMDEGLKDLADFGSTSTSIAAAGTAVSTVTSGTSVAKSSASAPNLARTTPKRISRV